MTKLTMVRHGQSVWNQLNIFTGWVDVPLSQKGIQEAFDVGKLIKNFPIDIIFTSTLIRAQMSATLALIGHSSNKVPLVMHSEKGKQQEWAEIFSEKSRANCIPTYCAWELNERMYGRLQGLNKTETAEKYGAEQVHIWRRSFDVAPPHGESLEMTAARSIPYFKNTIVPFLDAGKNILIVAHGNSLRSIVMQLDTLTKEEVLHYEIPTGGVIVYDYTKGKFTKESA